MLDQNLKNQLKEYLKLLEGEVVFTLSLDDSEKSKEVKTFVEEIVSLSDLLKIEEKKIRPKPMF